MRFNPPGNVGINVDEPYLADPLAGFDPTNLPANTRSSLTVISPDLASPYSHQYNFSWEPGLWQHVRLQLGYVGSRTHKLFASWKTNRADLVEGVPQTSATVNQRRPNPDFFAIEQVLNGSRAFYDAARVLIIPQWRGWSLETSYWLSKAIDLGGDYSSTGASGGAPPQADSLIHDDTRGVSSFTSRTPCCPAAPMSCPRSRPNRDGPAEALRLLDDFRALLMKSGTPSCFFPARTRPASATSTAKTATACTSSILPFSETPSAIPTPRPC